MATKKLLLFILFTASILHSYSQSTVKWSDVSDGNNSDAQFIVGNNYGNIFLLNRKSGFFLSKDKWYIETYNDTSLKKINSTEIIFGKTESFEESVSLQQNNYIFTNSFIDNTKKLLAYSIDKNGIPNNSPQEISAVDKCESRNNYNFHFLYSTDTSKLCIYHIVPRSEEESKHVKVIILNEKLQIEHTKIVELPFQSRECFILNATLSNDIFAGLLKVADDDKLRIFTNRTYSYYTISYNIKADSVKLRSINLEKKSNIVGSSFYTLSNKEIGICGFYRVLINDRDKVVKPFNSLLLNHSISNNIADYVDDYATPNAPLNIFRDVNNYNYEPLLNYVLPNDKVVLVCEKNYVETSCLTDFRTGMQRCNYYYHVDNVEAYIFEKTYESKKKFAVEKKQISINDDGYFLGSLGGYFNKHLYLIYNDSKLNTSTKRSVELIASSEIHYMNSAKKANVVLSKINEDGKISKQILFTNAGNKTVFVPQKSIITNTGKIIFYCKRSSRFKIGVMDLK